jgi:hypothetical protein
MQKTTLGTNNAPDASCKGAINADVKRFLNIDVTATSVQLQTRASKITFSCFMSLWGQFVFLMDRIRIDLRGMQNKKSSTESNRRKAQSFLEYPEFAPALF